MEWGVVVAADQGAEWLLQWWWNCYSQHQEQPVAFIDFGMSSVARSWCSKRGLLIPYTGPNDFVTSKEGLRKREQQKWEAIYGPKVWQARPSWFKKPWAMLQTPFKQSIWMDLDCEVCKPIHAILEGVHPRALGAVRVDKRGHYNSGVIVYDRESLLLHAWAAACLTKHNLVIGDETVLSRLIHTRQYPFKELAPEFNWMMGWGYHPDLKIAHWAASWGKFCIETMGGIQHFFTQCDAVKPKPAAFFQQERELFS